MAFNMSSSTGSRFKIDNFPDSYVGVGEMKVVNISTGILVASGVSGNVFYVRIEDMASGFIKVKDGSSNNLPPFDGQVTSNSVGKNIVPIGGSVGIVAFILIWDASQSTSFWYAFTLLNFAVTRVGQAGGPSYALAGSPGSSGSSQDDQSPYFLWPNTKAGNVKARD